MKYALSVLFLVACVCPVQAREELRRTDDMGRDYVLYLPDEVDQNRTYWLVVGVHGAGGNPDGAGGLAGWADALDNVIVLSPAFPNGRDGREPYQYLGSDSDQQLLDLFETLSEEFQLHNRFYLSGFSGGGQYTHRFMMMHPGVVAGCGAHSPGTWATGDLPWQDPNMLAGEGGVDLEAARRIPLVISCGEEDTGLSFQQCPMGRLAWAQAFAVSAEEAGLWLASEWVPGVGHRRSPVANELDLACFTMATEVLPRLAAARQVLADALAQQDLEAALDALVDARSLPEQLEMDSRLADGAVAMHAESLADLRRHMVGLVEDVHPDLARALELLNEAAEAYADERCAESLLLLQTPLPALDADADRSRWRVVEHWLEAEREALGEQILQRDAEVAYATLAQLVELAEDTEQRESCLEVVSQIARAHRRDRDIRDACREAERVIEALD